MEKWRIQAKIREDLSFFLHLASIRICTNVYTNNDHDEIVVTLYCLLDRCVWIHRSTNDHIPISRELPVAPGPGRVVEGICQGALEGGCDQGPSNSKAKCFCLVPKNICQSEDERSRVSKTY